MVGEKLAHDAKKWEPVFRKKSCANKNLQQNADSGLMHFAVAFRASPRTDFDQDARRRWLIDSSRTTAPASTVGE
jgi:hypothetical protein